MTTIGSLVEVILYVRDVERMTAFYRDAFELDVSGGDPDHGFVRFDAGSCDLCLHAGRDGDLGSAAPSVTFAVDDLDAARDHLAGFDVDLGDRRNPAPGVHVVDGRDPEGNAFSIETTDDG